MTSKRYKHCELVSNHGQDIFAIAHQIAKKRNATLESTNNLSFSHGQTSLRFTCMNGHNFYMPIEKLSLTDFD